MIKLIFSILIFFTSASNADNYDLSSLRCEYQLRAQYIKFEGVNKKSIKSYWTDAPYYEEHNMESAFSIYVGETKKIAGGYVYFRGTSNYWKPEEQGYLTIEMQIPAKLFTTKRGLKVVASVTNSIDFIPYSKHFAICFLERNF